MIINDPDTLFALTAAFSRYEQALIHNDLGELDALFWNSDHTVRYGVGENLYGFAAIREFRIHRRGGSPPRVLRNTLITTYGTDFGTANTSSYATAPRSLADRAKAGCGWPRAGASSPRMCR